MAVITVTGYMDDGGIATGGVTPPQIFTVTVLPINTAPLYAIPNRFRSS